MPGPSGIHAANQDPNYGKSFNLPKSLLFNFTKIDRYQWKPQRIFFDNRIEENNFI